MVYRKALISSCSARVLRLISGGTSSSIATKPLVTQTMNFFLKAAEIWIPDMNKPCLTLGSSDYSQVPAFGNASSEMSFEYGKGLPGETWKAGHPLIWNDLDNDAFLRSGAAKEAGLACGVSIPVFGSEFLQAVLVLFFAEGEDLAGAVELWSNTHGDDNELNLVEGYFGKLERFEWITRRLTILRGRGLPGTAWESGKPLIIDDLGSSSSFLRARNAAEDGITTGLAIPLQRHDMAAYILCLLSAKGTPIAHRFEIWQPNVEGKLQFDSGYCDSGIDLKERYQQQQFTKGEGILGLVWLTGQPRIGNFSKIDDKGDKNSRPMIFIPVSDSNKLVSIVALGL